VVLQMQSGDTDLFDVRTNQLSKDIGLNACVKSSLRGKLGNFTVSNLTCDTFDIFL